MSINLLKLLIDCSEKSANIARRIRADETLLRLLTQEKSVEEANPRFVQDFKTLADVLIQETIRYEVSKVFPEIEQSILGEESSEFTNCNGDSVCVKIGSTELETKETLEKVLDGDFTASRILTEEVHKTIDYQTKDLGDIPEIEVDYTKIGVWIDPIDATKEYINGDTVFSDFPGITSTGLDCVTVLIGVYDKVSGAPLIGVVNQPFHKKLEDQSYESKVYWGVSIRDLKANNIQKTNHDLNIALFSTSEDRLVLEKVKQNNYELAFSAGAGHKILKVILNDAKWFLLTKGSTYKWDTCAPHAILISLGGGVLDLKESLKSKSPVTLSYSSGKANSNGIFAYQEESQLNELFSLNLTV